MKTPAIRNGRPGDWPVVVAGLAACLIFGALVGEMKKYVPTATAVDEARKVERAKALAELRAAEAEQLNNAAWLDPAKGLVRLPIAEAMQLALRQWQNPALARSNLIARVEKATAAPPKSPEKPSAYE